jgi:hypothetical protein
MWDQRSAYLDDGRTEDVPDRAGLAGDDAEAGERKRPLGIPTIRDRVVQTAVKLVLEKRSGPAYKAFRPTPHQDDSTSITSRG